MRRRKIGKESYHQENTLSASMYVNQLKNSQHTWALP